MTMILTALLIIGIFAAITSLHLRISLLEKKFDFFVDFIIKDNNKTKNVFADRIDRNRWMVELLAKKMGYTFVDESKEIEND